MRRAVQKESREMSRRGHEYIPNRFRAAEAPLGGYERGARFSDHGLTKRNYELGR